MDTKLKSEDNYIKALITLEKKTIEQSNNESEDLESDFEIQEIPLIKESVEKNEPAFKLDPTLNYK
ncbi:3137_t:CDS:2 [Diversispora eburnea]|uniref:3137_t:CDS:1 n=1 Tax=Diversispora eburnea TaxID=1213867 RepID=A0A9N9A596_9GLOM|nr:3137_t:CDS:2 [Diversispora eburnea]